MVEIYSFDLAKARQRVMKAERSLARAHEMLGERAGVAVNLSLCDRIRSEEQSVLDAKQRLTKIEPNAQY